MADLELTVLYEEIEDGWVMASIPELPGVRTQGATRDEARSNVLDALRLVLSVQAEETTRSAPEGALEHLEFALTA